MVNPEHVIKLVRERRNLFFKIVLLSVILFAIFFRVWGIDSESYWLDEAISVRQAQEPLEESIGMVKKDTHLPLYITLLNVWVHLFGVSEASTRLMSAVFGVASVYVIFLLGRKLFNKKVGLYSSVILAFSSISIYYSQEARLYSLFVFLAMLSFYFYVSFMEKKNLKNTLLYAFFTLLMIYTFLFAALVMLVQNVYYFLKNMRNSRNLLHWIILQAALFAVFVPWITVLFEQLKVISYISWIARPTPMMVFWTFNDLFSNLLVLSVFLLTVSISAYILWKSRGGYETRHLELLAIWALLPVAVVIAFSLFFTPVYHTRYFLFSLPAFYLLFAWSLSRVPGKKYVQIVLVILIMFFSAITIVEQYERVDKQNWRGVSLFIKENVKEGEVVFIHPFYHHDPFSFYYDRECFSDYFIHSCNFNKHGILSLNHRAECCNDSTILTSTNERNELKDYVEGTIWLIDSQSDFYDVNKGLFNYFKDRKEITFNRTFEDWIEIYKFE